MDLSVLTFEELKVLAKESEGFKFHPSIGEDKLRANLTLYIEENPGCLDDTEKEPKVKPEIKPEIKPEEKPVKGMVKIKSIHRGEIASSVGVVDFGEDGIVEVTAEQAELFLSIPEGYEKC